MQQLPVSSVSSANFCCSRELTDDAQTKPFFQKHQKHLLALLLLLWQSSADKPEGSGGWRARWGPGANSWSDPARAWNGTRPARLSRGEPELTVLHITIPPGVSCRCTSTGDQTPHADPRPSCW